MALRLSTVAARIIRTNECLQRHSTSTVIVRNFVSKNDKYLHIANMKNEDEDEDDQPVKYLGSKAQMYQARDNWRTQKSDIFWFEPFVISFSLAIFLIYFAILREENDIDERLDMSLFDQLDRVERELDVEEKKKAERASKK